MSEILNDLIKPYSLESVEEIRIKKGCRCVIKLRGSNVIFGAAVTTGYFDDILSAVCEGSYHTHADSAMSGYIDAGEGMRVGVVGRAVLRGGQIDNIKGIDYLAIRVPHLIIGICAPLLARIRTLERGKGVLIYSRPGVGKTTVLRDLSLSLASAPYNSKIAVIDSRQEIRLQEMERFPLICFYSGYPKGQAIEAAIRSVSPDFIISDEIGSGNEASALFNAVNSGVSIIATAHAGGKNDVMNKPLLTELIERGAFSLFCGLERDKNNRTSFIFDEDTVSKV